MAVPVKLPAHQPGGSHSPLLYLVTAAPSLEATLTTEKLKSIVSSVNRLLFSSIYLLRHLGQIFAIKLKSVKHGCLQIFTLVLTTALLPFSVTLDLTAFFLAQILPFFWIINFHYFPGPSWEILLPPLEAKRTWGATHYGAVGKLLNLLWCQFPHLQI